ncbi:hypothetical protein L2E82_17437 [Cichorium intybus]|uniref:Uncharacterized protein n=1 Tax=Cichorium intybus TaxID=13427 RepID=A0ACB9F894_CICIN|nr:hypothetical protein L2E82_17437 [Cichorium intybus]
MRSQSGKTVIEVEQSVNQHQILNRSQLLQCNKRSRSDMSSEIDISDEGEASENSSMEMIEVLENSGDEDYETNKYRMIFVPFTAIDNHRKSVTIGAGLLSNETIESYTWLLEAFLKAHGTQPKLVLTDQDPALIQAVERVFPESKHRLCMWHITQKLQKKVSPDFLKKTDFRKRFNKLVWNVYLEPETFEKEWNILIKEYKLEDNRWFNDMFNIRENWIPATRRLKQIARLS